MKALLILLAACGGSKKPSAPVDVAGVNAAVPAALKATLQFEEREIEIELGDRTTRYALAVPTSFLRMPWIKPSVARQTARLGDLGVGYLDVGARCDHECGVRDWKFTIQKREIAPLLDDQFEIIEDATATVDGLQRRTVVLKKTSPIAITAVVQASYIEGGDRYYVCTASLQKHLIDAAPVFVKVCGSMVRSGDDAMPGMSTAKPPPNYVDVPHFSEIELVIPDGTKVTRMSNAMMASFDHPDGWSFIVEAGSAAELDYEASQPKYRDVKEWLSHDKLADGWLATTREEPIAGGPDHGLISVQRLRATVYRCMALAKREHIPAIAAACKSIRLKR